jgi:hypothetical protein
MATEAVILKLAEEFLGSTKGKKTFWQRNTYRGYK